MFVIFIHLLHSSPRECCKALLEDWVTTDNGAKPKTWNSLIDILSEIEELQPVIDEIKQNLIGEGVTLVGVYKFSYVYIYIYIYIYICCTHVWMYAYMYCIYTRMEAWARL